MRSSISTSRLPCAPAGPAVQKEYASPVNTRRCGGKAPDGAVETGCARPRRSWLSSELRGDMVVESSGLAHGCANRAQYFAWRAYGHVFAPERSNGAAVDAGARCAFIPAEVAAVSDVTITMVTDTAAVEAVALGPGGIIEGARAGSVVIDHSTIDPRRTSNRLGLKNTRHRHARCAGIRRRRTQRPDALDHDRGDEPSLKGARPILECYGNTIMHIGPHGAVRVAKACNNRTIVTRWARRSHADG